MIDLVETKHLGKVQMNQDTAAHSPVLLDLSISKIKYLQPWLYFAYVLVENRSAAAPQISGWANDIPSKNKS